MKSEVDQELLKEYLDGDPAAEEALFARYDRELEVSPGLWAGIEDQIVPVRESSSRWWMGIAAGLVLSIGFLSLFLLSQKNESLTAIVLPEREPVVIQRRPAETKTGKRNLNPITKKPITSDKARVVDNP